MKYSTAAFTFALALLAANNDVADAGGFNLRGRGAINRRRARHLKGNQDTTGDDAIAADNRATPEVAADSIIAEDTDIVEEEAVESKKSHEGAAEKMEAEVETIVTEIENMAEAAVEAITGEKEKGSSQSSDEEELDELAVVDGVEGEGKVRIFYVSRVACMAIAHYTYIVMISYAALLFAMLNPQPIAFFLFPFITILHSISAQGKGKGDTDDDAEARADGDEDNTETLEESTSGKGKKKGAENIEEAAWDETTEESTSGKGKKKGSKDIEEATDDIEAKTDVAEATEEIESIKSCKGKHCNQNTTSVEEEEEKKPCKGRSCDEDELGDAEVRAEGAADEEPSKVSKMSSDETGVRNLRSYVCGFHHLLLFFRSSLLAYFLFAHTNIFLRRAVSFYQQDATEATVADANDIVKAVTVGKGKKGKKSKNYEEGVKGDGAAEESEPEKEKKESKKSHAAAALVIGDSAVISETIAHEDEPSTR